MVGFCHVGNLPESRRHHRRHHRHQRCDIDQLCSQPTPPKPAWSTQPSADDDGHRRLSLQVALNFSPQSVINYPHQDVRFTFSSLTLYLVANLDFTVRPFLNSGSQKLT